ncbi:glutathione S-transferase family protein [Parasphingorhabdus sp.]|uniref:glutathione S-transferase family protein n=1 Tax=Parasphingorhabdus sp. TaxID=2709688 RepID=UPI002F92F229
MSLTFYTNPMSRGQIARWALHEAGAQYDQVLLDYDTTMKGEDYLAINPMGKVPAIVHDGRIVTECAAICAYLADTFPDSGLAPTEDERADYYRWMFFAAGPVEAAVMHKTLELEVDPEKERMLGYGNFDRVIDVLDQKLSDSDYICGDRFTMADVYVGSHVDWGQQFGSMPERDSFQAYAQRLRDRETYKASKAVDAALMPEQAAS